jgi:hypothetical protein
MWEPRRLTTLRASTACYRDSLTFCQKLWNFTVKLYLGNRSESDTCTYTLFCLAWPETMTSQNTDLSSWDILYSHSNENCVDALNLQDCEKVILSSVLIQYLSGIFVPVLMFVTCILEKSVSNHGRDTYYTNCGFSWCLEVPLFKCWDSTWN